MASTPSNKPEAAGALPSPELPLRIGHFLYIWSGKTIVKKAIRITQVIMRLKSVPPSQRPNVLNAYQVRPHLTHRVFVPPSHNKNEMLPLYIDMHAGGFVMGEPFLDDEFCSHFCNTYNLLVISLNYSKSPSSRFPIALDDIISTVQAVLSDDFLPIYNTRVVIDGFSSGGSLALSAAQAPELRGKINRVVSWYGLLDYASSLNERLNNRLYPDLKQPEWQISADPALHWAYIKPGQDLRGPKLSINFAKRETLPKWLFFVAAEYDILCHESKEMIMNVAELKGKEREEGIYGFEKGTYKWRMARGVPHGYTHWMPGGSAAEKELRDKRRDETFAEVGEWLFNGPFARQSGE